MGSFRKGRFGALGFCVFEAVGFGCLLRVFLFGGVGFGWFFVGGFLLLFFVGMCQKWEALKGFWYPCLVFVDAS